MDDPDFNMGLLLGLGSTHATPPENSLRSGDSEAVEIKIKKKKIKKKLVLKFDDVLPSLTLGLSASLPITCRTSVEDDQNQQASSASVVSSFSNTSTFKRDRDGAGGGGGGGSGEEKEAEVYLERVCEEEDEDGSPRKKLRLTKEQSAILEDRFKEHASLSPKQKQDLARQLNLRPRQVEVWFQNRRARTKLKQTEMDCELLKKCCEKLKEENIRLQKELQELKSLKLPPAAPFCMKLQAATLAVCPSCEKTICSGGGGGGGAGGDGSTPTTTFSIGPTHHFLKYPFTHPSAAC